jgi:pantoate--beta-alanine ligase
VTTDPSAGQHHRSVPEPRSVSDDDRAFGHRLFGNGQTDVFVSVVLIGDVDVMARPHIVSDHDLEVPDDATALPDETAVTDPHDSIVQTLLTRDHPGGQSGLRADHGVPTDVDELLVEDRVEREADDAPLAERSEPSPACVVGAHGTEFAQRLPSTPDAFTGETTRTVDHSSNSGVGGTIPVQHGPHDTLARCGTRLVPLATFGFADHTRGTMDILDSPGSAHAWSNAMRIAGRTIGFVPTMGALHSGHVSLIEIAAERADVVVVSIFVNPLQFDRSDDFDTYPRLLEADLDVCRRHGVAAVYAPSAASMYPEGFQTDVDVRHLSTHLEGAGRPGHFRGVTTVVTKLFNALRPHVAMFGMKDFQQLRVVERLASDLDFGVEIVRCPTARDDDGLALSSRNVRLSPAARAAAPCLAASLTWCASRISAGVSEPLAVAQGVIDRIETATSHLDDVRVEYVTVSDAESLRTIDGPLQAGAEVVVSLAVWFGDVRLIDNVVVSVPPRH